jgi:two-component system LytT family sensor kinase
MKATVQINWKRVGLHALFWALVLSAYWLSSYTRGYQEHFWFAVVRQMPIDLFIVYFNAYFLLPRFLLKKRLFTFFALFLSVAAMALLATRLLDYYVIYPRIMADKVYDKPFFYFPEFLLSGILMYSFVFLFSGVRLFRAWWINQQRQRELERQNLTSELALLRSQVNPHFLFNTLNNIDTLVYKDQEKASDALVKLSGIMRYMLYEATTDKVPLEKEIDYLESMVDLIRLRLKDPGQIELTIKGNPEGKRIAPMLLVPFIENAYKHGSKQAGSDQPIRINLAAENGRVRLEVFNPVDQSAQQKDAVGGIGLQNVNRRLQLLYPGDFDLDIQKESGSFKVRLDIPSY